MTNEPPDARELHCPTLLALRMTQLYEADRLDSRDYFVATMDIYPHAKCALISDLAPIKGCTKSQGTHCAVPDLTGELPTCKSEFLGSCAVSDKKRDTLGGENWSRLHR
mmetsp:Transcript_29789/g.40401  ORF Transcript_29789/g.40401 Transcript_29789/m.40401 type:complete len:109 (+) Transcript_29789:2149-2475(+)